MARRSFWRVLRERTLASASLDRVHLCNWLFRTCWNSIISSFNGTSIQSI